MFAPATAAPAPTPVLPSLPSLPKPREPCPYCPLTFDKAFNLRRHLDNIHPALAGKERIQCTLCSAACYSQKALAKHLAQCQGAAAVVPSGPPSSAVAAAPSPSWTSSASSSSSSAPTTRVPITAAAVRELASDFHLWMTTPALLKTERQERTVSSQTAADAAMAKLRLLFVEADGALPSLFDGGLHLRLLVVPEVVDAVMESMQQRGLKPCSTKPAALLLKLVGRYLCARQSKAAGTLVEPHEALAGWSLIVHHCKTTNAETKRYYRRKQIRGEDDDKHMTTAEKNLVLSRCLAVLQRMREERGAEAGGTLSWDERMEFTDHLVVALLLLGLAPRQQTFRGLTVEMVRPPGEDRRTPLQYVIDGEHGKTKLPYYLAVHPVLTTSMAFYLERVLPCARGALFLQQGGAARQDFTAITRALTTRYIDRPITAGKFRMTVATDLLGREGVKGGTLAALMGHSEATQQQWYVGREMAKDARVCQDALLDGVVVPAGMLA